MTEELKQKFKETYPDFMRGDEPLSPYFDIWEYGIEIATKELQETYKKQRNKRIDELQKKNHDLEAQVEKMKCCEICDNSNGCGVCLSNKVCENHSEWKLKE